MSLRHYKYTHRLNIVHSLNQSNLLLGKHQHTIIIEMLFVPSENTQLEFHSYDEVQDMIEQYFKHYDGRFINEIPPFNNTLPTIEAIGELFYDDLIQQTENSGFYLKQLEISEIPSRIYTINEFLKNGTTGVKASKQDRAISHYVTATSKYLELYIRNKKDHDERIVKEKQKEEILIAENNTENSQQKGEYMGDRKSVV